MATKTPFDRTRDDGDPNTQSLPACGTGVALDPGCVIDRYTILSVVGQGGAGTVYAAHDDALDRDVALKIMHAEKSGLAAERLLREGQSLARLKHPNVVSIHDVGHVGGRVYIVMELVESGSLRRWLAAAPRTWREVVATMVQAGKGLSAAHHAGLIHRDFTLNNVLVGEDGRVRVTDFGLVEVEPDVGPQGGGSLTTEVAAAPFAPPGTPGYIAPEIFQGAVADARSDQFSFAVCLYDALFGRKPFEPELIASGALDVPRFEEPRGERPPRWVLKALLRALAPDPRERFPNMEALLDRLQGRRHTARWAVAAAVVVVATVVGGVWLHGALADAPCSEAQERLDQVWNASRSRRVQDALRKRGGAPGEETSRRLARALDLYGDRWRSAYTKVCRATRVHKVQSEQLLDSRMTCLDRRLSELDAFVDAVATGNEGTVESVVEGAYSLPDVEACAEALPQDARTRRSLDAGRGGEVEAIRRDLVEIRARLRLNEFVSTKEWLDRIEPRVRATGSLALQAEFDSARSSLLALMGNVRSAEKTAEDALWAAEATADDEVTAEVLNRLVYMVGYSDGRFDEAMHLARRADAAIVRSGEPVFHRAALEYNIGAALHRHGSYEEAQAHFERSLVLRRQLYGDMHPDVAASITGLGATMRNLGRRQEALELHRQALDLRRRIFGPRHAVVAGSLSNVGELLTELGDHDGAVESLRAALDMQIERLGPGHAHVSHSTNLLGKALFARGDRDAGLARLRHAVAIQDEAESPDAYRLPLYHADLAETLCATGARDSGVAEAERGLRVLANDPGDDALRRARLHEVLERCRAATNGTAAAATP